MDFNIRANYGNRADPRNPEYERLYRNEKMANIARVEENITLKLTI